MRVRVTIALVTIAVGATLAPSASAHDGHARSLLRTEINRIRADIDKLVVCAPGAWNCNRAAAYRLSQHATSASGVADALTRHALSARVKSGVAAARTAFRNLYEGAYKLFVSYGYQEVDEAGGDQLLQGQRQLTRAISLIFA